MFHYLRGNTRGKAARSEDFARSPRNMEYFGLWIVIKSGSNLNISFLELNSENVPHQFLFLSCHVLALEVYLLHRTPYLGAADNRFGPSKCCRWAQKTGKGFESRVRWHRNNSSDNTGQLVNHVRQRQITARFTREKILITEKTDCCKFDILQYWYNENMHS